MNHTTGQRREHEFIRRQGWLATGLIVLLLLNGGCLKVETTIALNADGSGILNLQYGITDATLSRMAKVAEMTRQLQAADRSSNAVPPQAPLTPPFTEKEIRALLKPYEARGLQLTDVKIESRREWRTVQLEIAFKDPKTLFDLPYFSTCSVRLHKTEAQYRLAIDLPRLSPYGPLPDMQSKENREVLLPLLSGLSVKMRIDAPAVILDTNADRKTIRAAMWEFDFDRNPQIIAKLDHYPLSLVFKGNNVTLPEYSRSAAEPPPVTAAGQNTPRP